MEIDDAFCDVGDWANPSMEDAQQLDWAAMKSQPPWSSGSNDRDEAVPAKGHQQCSLLKVAYRYSLFPFSCAELEEKALYASQVLVSWRQDHAVDPLCDLVSTEKQPLQDAIERLKFSKK